MKTIIKCFACWILLFLFPNDLSSQINRYVNLGLPSGTLWKNQNESGFYNYATAIQKFGKELPTKTQMEELKTICQWTWSGNGFIVVGPNGNSIFLPADGCRFCDGDVSEVPCGYYWSSTPDGSDAAYDLDFMLSSVLGPCIYIGNIFRCTYSSVRLVK